MHSWEQAHPSSSSDACFWGFPGCKVPISKITMSGLKAGITDQCWCPKGSTEQHWRSSIAGAALAELPQFSLALQDFEQTDAQPRPTNPRGATRGMEGWEFLPQNPKSNRPLQLVPGAELPFQLSWWRRDTSESPDKQGCGTSLQEVTETTSVTRYSEELDNFMTVNNICSY